MKKLRILWVLLIAVLVVGCSNKTQSTSSSSKNSTEYYEQLDAKSRKNVSFEFSANANISRDNSQNNPPKVTVDMIIKNKTKQTVEIDLSQFRLKNVDMSSNLIKSVKVKPQKSLSVPKLFTNVPVSHFSQPVIVTYYADKYEVGTIKSINNLAELNNWLANVTEKPQDDNNYTVAGMTLTQSDINKWIVRVLNKTNKVQMTTADYVFEYYQPDSAKKTLQIGVVENHQTSNWKKAGADPTTIPTSVRLQLTSEGELDNMETGKVFSESYQNN